jgi:hypothetical protein
VARSRPSARREEDLRVPAAPEKPVEGEVLAPESSDRELSSRYARNLIANSGDVVKALAATFSVDVDEAERRMVELHDRARKAQRAATTITEVFERHDVGIEVRVAAMREALFDAKPEMRMAAVRLLNDMDVTSKQKRMGTTWEEFVARARAKSQKTLEPPKRARAAGS